MSDEEIQHLLNAYVHAEMAVLSFQDHKESEYVYSPKYQRKLRRLLWSERYFNRRIKVGLALRRAAVILLIIVGLLAATEVTARVFGFNPWEYFAVFDDADKMGGIEFETMADSEPEEAPKMAVRDVPSYVPEGFEEIIFENNEISFNVVWKNEINGVNLAYSRSTLNSDFTFWYDGEYIDKEVVNIGNYRGEYYRKDESQWLLWLDKNYCYMIRIQTREVLAGELLRMAESIYK